MSNERERDVTTNTAGPADNTGAAPALPLQRSATSPVGFTDTAGLLRELPVCKRTLFNLRASGKIPYLRLNRRILYHLPSVEAALLRMQRGIE